METGADRYRLNLAHGEYITITPTILGEWEVALGKNSIERIIARDKNQREVVACADGFVATHRKDSIALVYRHSRWRRQPASDKQLHVLKTRGIKVPKGLTKGQASHVIGMLGRG